MRSSKGLAAFAAASLLSGLVLTTAMPATAAPANAVPLTQQTTAAPATTQTSESTLTADKSHVHAENTLLLTLNHGPERVNWISSPAFVPYRENPVIPGEGIAKVTSDQNGVAKAVATIDHVRPGTYRVHTRVGGGNGPDMTITVLDRPHQ